MKDKIKIILFLTIIFSCSLAFLIKEETEVSILERRKLMTKEKLKKDIAANLDKYLTEQFPVRNEMLKLNTFYNKYILNNYETNNVYLIDNYIIEKNYPINEKSINNFTNKINYISSLSQNNKYFIMIPDKSYFLKDNYLKIDYKSLEATLKNNLNPKYINVSDKIKLEDYYKTDIHLKQESYFKILEHILNKMNIEYKSINYKTETFNDFYGASYSKYPLTNREDLTYHISEYTSSAKVKHMEYNLDKVYEVEKLKNIDPYDIFLGGASAYIEIETTSISDKELIIFRDSFASSLTPLLLPYYKKITLVDLRYIDFSLVREKLDFKNSEILFIFSSLIINNSSILKVNYS